MSVRRKQRLLLLFGVVFLGTIFFMFLTLSSEDLEDDFSEDAGGFQLRLLKEIEQELDHYREMNNEVKVVDAIKINFCCLSP